MASGNSIQHTVRVSSYFLVVCDGKTIDTVVACHGSVVERWVNEILLAHASDEKVVVGLDIKQSKFKSETGYHMIINNRSATMQLCIDTKCLIIQLLHITEIPQSFKSFLMNPKFIFMGVDEDMAKLVSEYHLDFAKSADFRGASINKWPRRYQQHDLKYLAKQLLGLDVNNPADQGPLSDWGSKFLTENHVQYACVVAYASYKIAKLINIET